ncbi:MAG: DUF433 domain-containing protein [Chloroflexi bacterium]|jgi:uncharacterized protein (DUF433 family)|nr:DUF433 domain-containing protein [Chloroflexota bacterium]
MTTVLNIDLIVSNPAVRGGQPSIAGTGIRVVDVAVLHTFGGLTAEDIAVQLRLNLGQVHAALAYYYTHQTELDAQLRSNAEQAEHWRQVLQEQGRLF